MAYSATFTATSEPRQSLAQRFLDMLVRIGEANPRMRAMQKLAALSDEELAQRGLRRQDIINHLFPGHYL